MAEVALVGVKEEMKGQVAIVFVVPGQEESLQLRDAARRGRNSAPGGQADWSLWPPAAGLLRLPIAEDTIRQDAARTMQALCEGQNPGDLSSIEDPGALQVLKRVLEQQERAGVAPSFILCATALRQKFNNNILHT